MSSIYSLKTVPVISNLFVDSNCNGLLIFHSVNKNNYTVTCIRNTINNNAAILYNILAYPTCIAAISKKKGNAN